MQSSSTSEALPTSSVRLGETTVTVVGDVDVSIAPKLHQQLLDAFHDGARRVTVDLSRIDFIDSTGMGVLVNARNRAAATGCLLKVVLPEGKARFPFDVTGLSAKFADDAPLTN